VNRLRLWQRLWRRPLFRRGFYETVGLLLARRDGMQMLNSGYALDGYPHFRLPAAWEPERLGFQLYHHLATRAAIRDRDVIEIGCGRGGGGRFLAAEFAPRSYVATDPARLLARGSAGGASPSNYRVMTAPAYRLPVPDAAFDVCLGVEALHSFPHRRPEFLAETARVLRPAGRMYLADFFYTRESSPNATARFRAAVEQSPMRIVDETDCTAATLAALESDSARRLAEIGRLPRLMRGPARAFAATTESPLYKQLRDGRAEYLHLVLAKR
jgi:SAM-dependent methyltransferase